MTVMYNGIINVYKEKGYTSADVVALMRGILKQKKVGHTGTLDPDAEGVLPICAGAGTRLCEELTNHTKEYSAVMKLGVSTDTQDMTGNVISTHGIDITEQDLRCVILSFMGGYDQIPPMYSALKVGGKKLCDLARKGRTVERKPRHVDISDITITDISMPYVSIDVTCSKGTYIRTLCNDIGEKAGCGAAMSSLVRTRVGDFRLSDARKLGELQKMFDDGKGMDAVITVEEFYKDLPEIIIKDEMRDRLFNGNSFGYDAAERADISEDDTDIETGCKVRVYNAQNFFYGIFERGADGLYHPDKMMLCERTQI